MKGNTPSLSDAEFWHGQCIDNLWPVQVAGVEGSHHQGSKLDQDAETKCRHGKDTRSQITGCAPCFGCCSLLSPRYWNQLSSTHKHYYTNFIAIIPFILSVYTCSAYCPTDHMT